MPGHAAPTAHKLISTNEAGPQKPAKAPLEPYLAGQRDYQSNYLDNYARTAAQEDPEEHFQSQLEILRMRPDWDEGRLPFYRRVFFHAHKDQVQKESQRAIAQLELRKQLQINGNTGLANELHRAERVHQQRRAEIIYRADHRGGHGIKVALEDAEKAYSRERAGLLVKADQMLPGLRKFYDEWGRDQDTVDWRNVNNYPRKVREYANANHLDPEDVLYWLEYFRTAD
jgi:hypothetical protein